MVKVDVASIPDHILNIREQPTINSPVTGKITETMSLTIVDEASGTGASTWGKLKSGAGWISLDYTVRYKLHFFTIQVYQYPTEY